MADDEAMYRDFVARLGPDADAPTFDEWRRRKDGTASDVDEYDAWVAAARRSLHRWARENPC